jgi:acetyltransferase-like isoleucine patch superfamily enzyme
VLRRPPVPDTPWHRGAGAVKWAAGELVHRVWDEVQELGAIGPGTRRGKRFGAFGDGSVICFPPTSLMNERFISIGRDTMIGPHVALSAGMVPGQECLTDPVVRIGDRCLIGRGSGIVGHLSIDIGDDVWTGHHVYITDQNHGYEDLDRPISVQVMPEKPVRIGAGSWLGHGTVVLPGATIGRHVVIGANSVVRGEIPDFCVAAGNPAKVIRLLRG